MIACSLLPHLQKAKFVEIPPHEGDNARARNEFVARRLIVHQIEIALSITRLLTTHAEMRMRHHM